MRLECVICATAREAVSTMVAIHNNRNDSKKVGNEKWTLHTCEMSFNIYAVTFKT